MMRMMVSRIVMDDDEDDAGPENTKGENPSVGLGRVKR